MLRNATRIVLIRLLTPAILIGARAAAVRAVEYLGRGGKRTRLLPPKMRNKVVEALERETQLR